MLLRIENGAAANSALQRDRPRPSPDLTSRMMVERLAHRIKLVVVAAAREGEELGLEIRKPGRPLGEDHLARLDPGGGRGHAGLLVVLGLHADEAADLALELLHQEGARAG